MKQTSFKILAVNGSARKNGNTALILNMVLSELPAPEFESEIINLADLDIAPCRGCFACKGRRNCVFSDDAFQHIFSAMTQADAIILGSPVYSADVSSKMRAMLERAAVAAAVNPGILRHKIGAAVAAVRRAGGMEAVDSMNHFFLNKEMILPGSTYWNMVYGKDPGDAAADAEGSANMHNLGQNIARLLRLTMPHSLK